jgi:hypothetical protein
VCLNANKKRGDKYGRKAESRYKQGHAFEAQQPECRQTSSAETSSTCTATTTKAKEGRLLMNLHEPETDKAIMTVIANRPANVAHHLSSSKGVFVQCRLANGQDALVPLDTIIDLTVHEIQVKIRKSGGSA